MRTILRRSVAAAVLLLPLAASATPVAYTFSGNLTGILEQQLPNAPQTLAGRFQVAVFGDTDTVQNLGYEASDGPSRVNNSSYATWTVAGLGTVATDLAEVSISPSLSQISLDWGGQAYPTSGTNGTLFDFGASASALAGPYGTLSDLVGGTRVALHTNLQSSGGTIDPYNSTFSLYYSNSQILHVQRLTNVSYSVVPVPLSSTDLLLLSGVTGLVLTELRRRNRLSFLLPPSSVTSLNLSALHPHSG